MNVNNPDSRIHAKALESILRSDAIVVSFKSDWYESLKSSRFEAVIRKRAPTTFKPRWLYFHLNVPKSSVCGRSEIMSIDSIDSSVAIEMTRELDMSQSQIRDYIGGNKSVFLYRIGKPHFPETEVQLQDLRRHLVYNPPQSFFILSVEAKELLDRVCGFGRVETN